MVLPKSFRSGPGILTINHGQSERLHNQLVILASQLEILTSGSFAGSWGGETAVSSEVRSGKPVVVWEQTIRVRQRPGEADFTVR